MSTNTLFRAGLFATMGVATMAIASAADAGPSRYGSVYDYERGHNCGQSCVAPQQTTPVSNARYGTTAPVYVPAPQSAPVYVDCRAMGTCAPAPAPVYTQPAYTPAPQPSYSYQQSAQMAPVNCPSGTTAQSDGTCLQGSSGYTGSVTMPGTFESSSSYMAAPSMAAPVDCPAGTTAQSDGTCMQGSSGYSSMGSTSSYSTGSSSYGGSSYSSSTSMGAVNCPAGTTAQPDGTCMQGGSSSAYTGSSVEIYQGDAGSTSSGSSYGYSTDGGYGPTDYLPIRK